MVYINLQVIHKNFEKIRTTYASLCSPLINIFPISIVVLLNNSLLPIFKKA